MKSQSLGKIICISSQGRKKTIEVASKPRRVGGKYFAMLEVYGESMRSGVRMHITADDAVQLSELLKTASEIAGKADNAEAERQLQVQREAKKREEERRVEESLRDRIEYHKRELDKLTGLTHKQRGECHRADCEFCDNSTDSTEVTYR